VTRLDDLLSYDDPPRRKRRRRPNTRLVRFTVLAVIASLLIWGFLRSRGVAVPYVLLLTICLAVVAMIEIIRRLSPPQVPDALRDTQVVTPKPGMPDADGTYRAVRRWVQRLDWSRDDMQRFVTRVRPAIVELVDERLWLRHAVSRATEPERAQALCGPDLWGFITVPVTRTISPNELATVVAAMEAL
jgi:hypothetical protein